jgi:hypothetical protein
MVKTWPTREDLRIGLLGHIDAPKKEPLEDEEPVKVTLLLPKDVVESLDQMVKNANVGSRGRLVQLLIDDILSLRGEYNVINTAFAAWNQKHLTENELLVSVTQALSGFQRKLLRYYGESVLTQFDSNSVKGKKRVDVPEP